MRRLTAIVRRTDWTPDQIGQFQLYWDSLLAGDLDRRRHTRFVPGGLEYHPTREPVLKDVFDDWLARVVCFAFSVSPTALVAQVNRATADSQKQSADEEGLAPVKLWVKELIDRLIEEDFGYADLEFGWTDDAPADAATLMSVNTGYVAAGIKTINEARAEIGLGPLPGGDTPEMETPTGPVPIGKGFDPNEPRDADGQGTSDGSSPMLTPVDLALPISPELLMPDWLTRPVPDIDIGPGVMPYVIPDDLTDEEKAECKQEWSDAYERCDKYNELGYLKDRNRRFGRSVDECVRGQVRRAVAVTQSHKHDY